MIVRTMIKTAIMYCLWSLVGASAAANGLLPSAPVKNLLGDSTIFGLQMAVACMMLMLAIMFLPYIFKTAYNTMHGQKLTPSEWGSFMSQLGFILLVFFLGVRNIIEVFKVLSYENVNLPWAATKLTYDSFIPYLFGMCGALLMVLTFERRRTNGLASGIVVGLTILVWIIGGGAYYYVFSQH